MCDVPETPKSVAGDNGVVLECLVKHSRGDAHARYHESGEVIREVAARRSQSVGRDKDRGGGRAQCH